MATKAQQIKQLEERAVLAEDKVNGLTEMAGDLFVGLMTAVEMLEDQKAILELDVAMLDVAGTVIGQQNEVIDRLERVERRRQREQELADKSAASLQTAMNQGEMANWALMVSTAMAKGLVFTTVPDRYGRTQKSVTDIDEYGKKGKTEAITKGVATITFDVPVFGKMEVEAKVRHYEVRETPDAKEVSVRNEVKFNIKMNGAKRKVLIVSGGRVRQGSEWEYTDYIVRSRFSQVLVDGSPYYCDNCHKYHGGGDEFEADVKTSAMPDPYQRPRYSGGCR